jgi:hypothetical protein
MTKQKEPLKKRIKDSRAADAKVREIASIRPVDLAAFDEANHEANVKADNLPWLLR